MSNRAATICILLTAGIAASGCTAYSNGQLCKQKMADTYPSSDPKLSFSVPRTDHDGTHVVAEATYQETAMSWTKVPSADNPGEISNVTKPIPAAVECTFEGKTLTTFRWLVPEKFAAVYQDVPDINGEVPKETTQLTAFPDAVASTPVAASATAAK